MCIIPTSSPLFQKLGNINSILIPLTFICFFPSIHSFSFLYLNQSVEKCFISPNRLHIKSHFSNLEPESILSSKAHFFTCVATEVYKIFNNIFTSKPFLMQVQFYGAFGWWRKLFIAIHWETSQWWWQCFNFQGFSFCHRNRFAKW